MKKKIALLGACVILSGFVSSPAYAEQKLVLTKDGQGNIMMLEDNSSERILEEFPDGKTYYLRGEHGEAIRGVTYRSADYVVTTAEGLPEGCSGKEVAPDSIAWEIGYENWFHQYPEGSRLYQIGDDVTEAKYDCMTYPSVIDALYLWEDSTNGSAYWTGTISPAASAWEYQGYIDIRTTGEITAYDVNGEVMDYPLSEEAKEKILLGITADRQDPLYASVLSDEAKAAVAEAEAIGSAYAESYQTWYSSIDADKMTPAEIEASRKQAGIESDFDMIQKAYALCDEIIEKYGDEFDDVTPNIEFRTTERTTVYRAESVWDEVGDIDEDGRITARDAARILERITSVASGALYTNETDRERKLAVYDINADGNINASDSALLLQYIAKAGTGEYDSLKAFLTESE